jgi:hypothetical protein
MRLSELVKLEAGTPINGISYSGIRGFTSKDPAEFRVPVLNTHSWDSNIKTPIRHTFFSEEKMFSVKGSSLLHSKTIIPYYDTATLRRNYLQIVGILGFGDTEGFFYPPDFIGVLLGETIVGMSPNLLGSSKDSICVEAFTRILFSDRIVWLRLWNYVSPQEIGPLKIISLEDVPLKLRP